MLLINRAGKVSHSDMSEQSQPEPSEHLLLFLSSHTAQVQHLKEAAADHKLWNLDYKHNPDWEQSEEPLQMKEEREELCTSLEVERVIVKQEDEDDDDDRELHIHNSHCAKIQELNDFHLKNVCNEEPEPVQIKEEEEEQCTGLEVEQIVLKQENRDESDSSETEPSRHLLSSKAAQNHNLKELPQHHVCIKEESLADHQPSSLGRDYNSDQEQPQPGQIKEEQDELITNLEGKQINGKLNGDDDGMLIPPFEESDHSEPEPMDHQLLSHDSHTVRRDGGNCKSARNPMPASVSNKRDLACNSNITANGGNGDNIFQCDTCGKSYKWKSRLDIHLRAHTGEKPYFCKTCGKGYTCSNSLRIHMRVHTGEKPYSCQTCGKTFAFSNSLMVHARTHTGEKPFSCKTCGKSFMSTGGLDVHTRMHTGEKPYPCPTCGKRFGDVSVLNKHLHIHTGEKPYSCQICQKDFRFAGDYKVHMRIHSGEKPYLCNTCGKRFAHASNLRQHVNIHNDDRPSNCETCGESFLSRSDLQAHRITHPAVKPYPCDTCGKRFGRVSTLKRHASIHSNDKPHICGTCGKGFRLWQKLAVHIRHEHPAPDDTGSPVGECNLLVPDLKAL